MSAFDLQERLYYSKNSCLEKCLPLVRPLDCLSLVGHPGLKACVPCQSFLYDSNAPKKPANLSLNSDLLEKSEKLKINLAATLEEALKQKLATIEALKWAKKNKNTIQVYNDFVEANGCFGDEFREF